VEAAAGEVDNGQGGVVRVQAVLQPGEKMKVPVENMEYYPLTNCLLIWNNASFCNTKISLKSAALKM
jgi:hypothetical protein